MQTFVVKGACSNGELCSVKLLFAFVVRNNDTKDHPH